MDSQILIILLHWKDKKELQHTISRISDDMVQIVVVNNEASASLELDPTIKIITNEKNLGFGGAINKGIQYGLDENIKIIGWINNDTDIRKDQIISLASSLYSDRNLYAIAPVLKEDAHYSLGGRDISQHINTRITANSLSSTEKARYLPGTAFLCKAEVFKHIGFLDPFYFFGGEMADICHRMTQAALPFKMSSDIIVSHFSTSDGSYTKAYYNLRSRIIYSRKHAKYPKWTIFKWYLYIIYRILAALLHREPKLARRLMGIYKEKIH